MWPFGKFPRKHVSIDKAHWKILCWFFRSVINHESRQNWFSRFWKWLPTEDSNRWKVLTKKDIEWSATAWSVVVWEPSRSWKSRMLHSVPCFIKFYAIFPSLKSYIIVHVLQLKILWLILGHVLKNVHQCTNVPKIYFIQ